jgi:cyclopropane-fatty-acyl-phospholipid synthase
MAINWLDTLLERGALPDPVVRWGIRRLLNAKHTSLQAGHVEAAQHGLNAFIADLLASPIAIETDAANEQHYEVPAAFFDQVLGPRRKYSSGLWQPGCKSLAQAEEAMLALYAERAQLQDGQRMLDLGCGWGSLSLWLAEKYPNSQITGLSNSRSQRQHIMALAEQKGLTNLTIWTGNIVHFEPDMATQDFIPFDRIVSIEMMEHMKNYALLFDKLSRWLTPEGKLFVHIFTHRDMPYHFEDQGPHDWMTRYFFSGGTMPSHNLLLHFQSHLTLEAQWAVNGTHYEKTANAWLANMDANRASIWPLLEATYGQRDARRWWNYWRIFFMACAELWGFNDGIGKGNAWLVSHYRFARKPVHTNGSQKPYLSLVKPSAL